MSAISLRPEPCWRTLFRCLHGIAVGTTRAGQATCSAQRRRSRLPAKRPLERTAATGAVAQKGRGRRATASSRRLHEHGPPSELGGLDAERFACMQARAILVESGSLHPSAIIEDRLAQRSAQKHGIGRDLHQIPNPRSRSAPDQG